MNKRDIAGYLGIDRSTLYNWEKKKPNLYKIVMQGFAFEEAVKKAKENYEDLEKLQKEVIENSKR